MTACSNQNCETYVKEGNDIQLYFFLCVSSFYLRFNLTLSFNLLYISLFVCLLSCLHACLCSVSVSLCPFVVCPFLHSTFVYRSLCVWLTCMAFCFFRFPEFNKVYERLQVRLVDRGESYYNERMKSTMKEFTDKGRGYIVYVCRRHNHLLRSHSGFLQGHQDYLLC